MNKIYRISRFLHFCNLNDISNNYCILYNSLGLGSIIVSRHIGKKIYNQKKKGILNINSLFQDIQSEEAKSNLLSELIKHRMILPIEKSEYSDYTQAHELISEVNIGLLYLLVSKKCNCKCKYCYMPQIVGADSEGNQMNIDSATFGIDIFIKNLSKNQFNKNADPEIILYGGEPLLNFSLIEKILKIIKQKKKLDSFLIGPKLF